MNLLTELANSLTIDQPIGLTIGNFDGLHLGHRHLLEKLRERTTPEGTVAVLTFTNHPSQVIRNYPPSPLIYPLEQKLRLLEEAGVDLTILLTFTKEFSEKSYDQFLKEVHQAIPFSFFMLGEGDVLGNARQGIELRVKDLGKILDFQAFYPKKESLDGELLSSGRIRECIQQGDLRLASHLLGRPYSLFGQIKEGAISLKGLCLPPPHDYQVTILFHDELLPAKGKIEHNPPQLKLALTEDHENLSNQFVEVLF